MNADIKAQLQKVDGMDVLDVAPEGEALFGPFRSDRIATLIQTARSINDRESFVIAPAAKGGFAIFAKPARKEAAK